MPIQGVHVGHACALVLLLLRATTPTYAGAPQSLFGFDGQQLVGQPLSSIIDIFTDWKEGHGEELSLLELLVRQLEADPATTKASGACASWRVGVHRPTIEEHADTVRLQAAALAHSTGTALPSGSRAAASSNTVLLLACLQGGKSTHGSSLLQALQPNRVQPACMKLEAMAQEPEEMAALLAGGEAAADATSILQVGHPLLARLHVWGWMQHTHTHTHTS